MEFVNLGFGNIAMTNRIVAVVAPESAPIKRLVSEARETKKAIDVTFGRRTRSVLVMDDGHVILSSVSPETIALRTVDIDGLLAKAEKLRDNQPSD